MTSEVIEIIIGVKDVTKRYANGALVATTALNQVNLTVHSGVFGILGPNGAGKTSLLRILATVMEPTAGTFRVGDVDGIADPQAVRKRIGYLPQEIGFFKNLTGAEYLEWVSAMKGVPAGERKRAVHEALIQVNLVDQQRKRIGALSGGMRRRLGIAQALLGNPPVLILDEPTTGLDLEEQIRVRNLLTSLGLERTVLLSTHIVADIESTCRNVAVLNRGRVVFSGGFSALIESAHGMVWEMEASRVEYEQLVQRHRVISAREHAGGMMLRLVAPEPPAPTAVGVVPNLEDAYLCHLEERAL